MIDLTEDVIKEFLPFANATPAESYLFTNPKGQKIHYLTHYVKRMFKKTGIAGNANLLRH